MDIDRIKDVVTARLNYIANCANAVVRKSTEFKDAGELNNVELDSMLNNVWDIVENVKSLKKLVKAIEPKEETDE